MLINEIAQPIMEAKLVWARKGNKIARKYRCGMGPRKGRLVSNPMQCSKPVDLKKRILFLRTKARLGAKMARKAQRTKRTSGTSKMIKALNK
jgi:hypothetical protein